MPSTNQQNLCSYLLDIALCAPRAWQPQQSISRPYILKNSSGMTATSDGPIFTNPVLSDGSALILHHPLPQFSPYIRMPPQPIDAHIRVSATTKYPCSSPVLLSSLICSRFRSIEREALDGKPDDKKQR